MKLRRVLTKRIDHDEPGLRVQASLNAVVAASVEERAEEADPPAVEPEEEAPDE